MGLSNYSAALVPSVAQQKQQWARSRQTLHDSSRDSCTSTCRPLEKILSEDTALGHNVFSELSIIYQPSSLPGHSTREPQQQCRIPSSSGHKPQQWITLDLAAVFSSAELGSTRKHRPACYKLADGSSPVPGPPACFTFYRREQRHRRSSSSRSSYPGNLASLPC
ncbi:uncharacterized protein K460DRAFT_100152 [Cucurbitaria berberidis CBS 394.84]|uniref:Uncharacterized protein n=1 Tax=Cucurbitaria berberidis CBS 394.84 TaxID=1168544 RepID=A0A9P4GG96_9PLEO|nr:uncharacterized protein K460DRAFT_100152 [Cucurbitaria berberidis CBS 394.84]KAF1844889.1 hypothetical protein K460DRAFT_100152 [Cucurbitaria berberidis CBS 394.84]